MDRGGQGPSGSVHRSAFGAIVEEEEKDRVSSSDKEDKKLVEFSSVEF